MNSLRGKSLTPLHPFPILLAKGGLAECHYEGLAVAVKVFEVRIMYVHTSKMFIALLKLTWF